MELDWLGWLILFAVPALAWLAASRSRRGPVTLRGYFLANQNLSSAGVSSAYFGANLTFTAIFLILSAEGYRRGTAALSVPLFWIIGSLLFVLCYPRLRPYFQEGTTLHQTLRDTFNSPRLQRHASFWTITAFMGTIALEFYGGIQLLQWAGVPVLTNLSIAILLAFVCVAFTVSGGLRGVVWADGTLNIFALLTTGILAYCVLVVAPQLPSPTSSQLANLPPLRKDNVLFVISMAVLFIPFQFCTFDSWQRGGAWEKRRNSPWWILVFGIVLAVCYAVPILLGMAVRSGGILVGGQDHPLHTFLTMQGFPPWLVGLVLAGFIAAVMSTADELLNCSAFTLIYDTFQVTTRPAGAATPLDEKKAVASGKFYVGVLGLISAALALLGLRWGARLSEMALAVFSVQVAFAVPVLFAMFGKKYAARLERAVLVGTWVSFCTAIAIVGLGWLLGDRDLADGAPVGGFVLGVATFGILGWIDRGRQRG